MTVNAFYNPKLNHIFVPLGILQNPLFDLNNPDSDQHSFLEFIIAHEITHGFDEKGVKYDENGEENPWLDDKSRFGFNVVKNCVAKQYSEFHIHPYQTVNEDLADSGGIRAAFNAYMIKNQNNVNKQQQFFINFARGFCAKKATDLEDDAIHSPYNYRVMGPIQNFPAFKEAFSCPDDSTYAPNRHCNVWN